MAFFQRDEKEERSYQVATIIAEGTTSYGNVIGNDTIHIDGEVEGDIRVNNIVIIGKSGKVNGNIQAQQVLVSGNVHGNIICNSLETMDGSNLLCSIKANKVLVRGRINGSLYCDGLFIEKKAVVDAKVQVKDLVVSGAMVGAIACEALTIKKAGLVRGEIYVNHMVNEGGTVEGAIGKYNELLKGHFKDMLSRKIGQVNLLEEEDYHVDVEHERVIENEHKRMLAKLLRHESKLKRLTTPTTIDIGKAS